MNDVVEKKSKTDLKGIFFGLLMSYTMAIGMEVYNVAIKEGFNLANGGFSNMRNTVFGDALKEAWYMGLIVFVVSNLWGNRIGLLFAKKHCDEQKDNPYFCLLMRQAGTVAIMCPSMSLIASILFNIFWQNSHCLQLPAIWIGTLIKNFPMAFFWNMFAAAPFTHFVFRSLFERGMHK